MILSKKKIIYLELVNLFGIYFLVIWVLIPKVSTSIVSIVLFFVLISFLALHYLLLSPMLIHKDSLDVRGLGLRSSFYIQFNNFRAAIGLYLLPLIIVGGGIVFAAWLRGSSFINNPAWDSFFLKFFFYLFSALLQDILFFSFILIRLKELINFQEVKYHRLVVVLIFGLLFSLVHLPNVPLMVLAFVFAFWLGFIFYKTPNLLMVVVVHATLGTLLHRVYELHMKIGYFYGNQSQEAYLIRHIIPAVEELIGNKW